MDKQQETAFESLSSETITQSGSSVVPAMAREKIESIEFKPTLPARRVMGIPLREKGVNSNPYVADRAKTVLLNMTFVCWGLSLIFLGGALLNFYFLEQIEISATSHDARIEPTGRPIKLGNL